MFCIAGSVQSYRVAVYEYDKYRGNIGCFCTSDPVKQYCSDSIALTMVIDVCLSIDAVVADQHHYTLSMFQC